MKEKRVTKKAILGSLLSVVICSSMLIGTSYAWFTDSVTSTGNKIKSGTLNVDLKVKDNDGQYQSVKEQNAPLYTYELWEPGYVDWTNFQVSTTGNLALKYTFQFTSNASEANNKLAEVIDVYFAKNEIAKPDQRPENLEDVEGLTKVGTLDQFFAGEADVITSMEGTLIPQDGQEEVANKCTIVLKMQEDAGNDYQNLSIEPFDICLYATQFTYEVDSFDKDYDADAEYPVAAAATGVAGQPLTLTAGDVTVTVPGNAVADGDKFELVVESKNITSDGFGEDTASYEIVLYKNGQKVTEDGTEYDVKIKVDAENVTSVVHNGNRVADVEFVDGKACFKTTSFSPFDVAYIAKGTAVVETNDAFRAALTNANVTNVRVAAGQYVDTTDRINIKTNKNIIGIGDVTFVKNADNKNVINVDGTGADGNVVVNIKNITFDGNNKSRNALHVKWNATVNLENVTFKNDKANSICIDNGNTLNGAYENGLRSIVNAKGCTIGKVVMDALPITSCQDYTTYAEFSYDAATTFVSIERQPINTGVDNIIVNGEAVNENGFIYPSN